MSAPSPRDRAAVVREQFRRRGISLTLTPDGYLKAGPKASLTDDDRDAIRGLRDALLDVVRADAARPARVLALAAELDWPEVHPFVGWRVGPGEARYRGVLEHPAWDATPETAHHRTLLLAALAGVLEHHEHRGRAFDAADEADEPADGRPLGRRRGHLRLLPLHDEPDDDEAAADEAAADEAAADAEERNPA